MAIVHQGAFDASAAAEVTKALVGSDTTDTIGFYGKTPVAQRSSSSQAAVSTTGSNSGSTNYGFTTATQADAIVSLVNELRAALVALGLIKGS